MVANAEDITTMWKQYYNVKTLNEAMDLLATYRERARIIAGGTDMMIELERGQRPDVEVLVDITRVPGLDEIAVVDGIVTLGPLVTHNHIVGDPRMEQVAMPLVLACWEVGAPQIRNRATVAGNLITASPANDTITPLIAMEASVTLSSSERGARTIALSDFYSGFRQTVMEPDEILSSIHFPVLSQNRRGSFYKLGLRRAQAISVVNAAAVLEFDGDIVQEAMITLGSVAPTIIRVPEAEAILNGNLLTADLIREAASVAATVPTPIDDVRGTAEYRTEMVRVLVSRVLKRILNGDTGKSWGEAPAMLWGEHKAQVKVPLATGTQHDETIAIATIVNGQALQVESGQDTSLLDFLRDHADLPGSKEGCAEGECGACTVFLDGVAVMSCMVPAPRAHGADIITIEGLRINDVLHPIQQAFVEEGAVQCGFCTPGFLMAGAKLLEEHRNPTLEQIQQSISGNLCRCTGYYKIVKAFQEAARRTQVEKDPQ
jgi:xanthine dehydrogenase iron-sulfur cluster and FAD-binding subunit A